MNIESIAPAIKKASPWLIVWSTVTFICGILAIILPLTVSFGIALAIGCLIGGENAVRTPLEHEVSGRAENAAAFCHRVNYVPRSSLGNRIPRQKLASRVWKGIQFSPEGPFVTVVAADISAVAIVFPIRIGRMQESCPHFSRQVH